MTELTKRRLAAGSGSALALASGFFGDRICFDKPNDQSADPDDLGKLADDLKAAATEVKSARDDMLKVAETAETERKNLGKITEETKTKFDELFAKHNDLAARFEELEQKLARRGSEEDTPEQKTAGQIFIEDEKAKSLDSRFRGQISVKISRKDITSAVGTVGSGASASTSLVEGMRVPGIVAPGDRMMTIRDLLAPGETSSNSVEYVRETGYTNLAGVVSEGVAKPKSDITFDLITAPVRTIAHYFKASRQIMDDAPALRSYIDARARYGLRYAEEEELLTGDGTGQHLNGIITQATAFNAGLVTIDTPQRIDELRVAALQVMLAEFPPTGFVMHPIDWAAIQLTKDAEKRYIIGNPADSNTPRLWNLPVVETQAMSEDTFLTGAFRMGAQIFDRMDIEVLLSTENEDDFIKNMITIRAEERLALAVYRTESFVYGSFGSVT
jgi:HK97 family phage major capsid protein